MANDEFTVTRHVRWPIEPEPNEITLNAWLSGTCGMPEVNIQHRERTYGVRFDFSYLDPDSAVYGEVEECLQLVIDNPTQFADDPIFHVRIFPDGRAVTLLDSQIPGANEGNGMSLLDMYRIVSRTGAVVRQRVDPRTTTEWLVVGGEFSLFEGGMTEREALEEAVATIRKQQSGK